MENLQQLMTLMTEECQVEFNTAMQEQVRRSRAWIHKVHVFDDDDNDILMCENLSLLFRITQNMELMSEDCKLQFSQAAGQTKGFREMQGG